MSRGRSGDTVGKPWQAFTAHLCDKYQSQTCWLILFVTNQPAELLFGLMLNVPVNSYGHVGTVNSPNHTSFPGQAGLCG